MPTLSGWHSSEEVPGSWLFLRVGHQAKRYTHDGRLSASHTVVITFYDVTSYGVKSSLVNREFVLVYDKTPACERKIG